MLICLTEHLIRRVEYIECRDSWTSSPMRFAAGLNYTGLTLAHNRTLLAIGRKLRHAA
jgi:hypothetical protein